MYYDRFNICEAWFLFLCHTHGGQWSPEYARLCRLLKHFSPSPLLSVESLGDNARAIYDNLMTAWEIRETDRGFQEAREAAS